MYPFAPITSVQGNNIGASPLALPLVDGAAFNRLNPLQTAGQADPMTQMLMVQDQMLTNMIGMLLQLMLAMPANQGASANSLNSGGSNAASNNGSASVISNGGSSSSGGSSSGGGNSGPVGPGAQGALDKARSMLGLNENSNSGEINKVTGKTGINSATTPWCAAFAINILKDAGILDTTGLKNPNYCPEIVRWAKEKGIWMERGSTPKPGDAILFDWQGDGTSDHIGIVEKVEGGKITTIEGNSSDSVKRNTYEIGSSKIMGFVKTKG